VQGHINFENVSFAYPVRTPAADTDGTPRHQSHTKNFALDEVSFEMLPGERVALVGPSGAGKTTITYLLPRLFDPAKGRITLDGHDLRDMTQESLRSHIGMVTQETFLFHETVRSNLLYARPDATHEQIVAAMKAAHIHDVVESLPEGYDTSASVPFDFQGAKDSGWQLHGRF